MEWKGLLHERPKNVIEKEQSVCYDRCGIDTYNAACGIDSKIASPAGAGEVASVASR